MGILIFETEWRSHCSLDLGQQNYTAQMSIYTKEQEVVSHIIRACA